MHDGPGGASRRQGDGSFVSLYDSRACRNFRTARSAPRRLGGFNVLLAVETRDARSVQVSFDDYRMNVALAAHGRCVAKKFRNRANRRFDVRLCLFLRLELFLFTKRDCRQYRATPGAEIFCGKIFTCDLAQDSRSHLAR